MIVKNCDRYANNQQTIVRNPDNLRQKSVDMGLRSGKNMVGWVGFFLLRSAHPCHLPRQVSPGVYGIS